MFLASPLAGQEKVLTVGFQYRPIIASEFFGTGPIDFEIGDTVSGTLTQRLGHSFGMSIRKGFTESISMEVGINWVRRNYDLSVNDETTAHDTELDFGLVAYEIPVQGLYYVRFTKQLYMDVAGGISLDRFASDVHSQSPDGSVYQYTGVRSVFFQLAAIANVGFEYRTKSSGYFYLGASYHQPFKDIGSTQVEYRENNIIGFTEVPLAGTYLTIDLRYFFHEKPQED